MGLVSVATWLHLLATVCLGGYYVVVTLVLLPALRAQADRSGEHAFLAAVERRAMPVLVASLIAFLATGVYLMTNDERYAGIGTIDSPWATLLLVKHVVIVVMLALGSWLDAILVRPVPEGAASDGRASTRVIGLFVTMTALTVVVLALTAAAQAP